MLEKKNVLIAYYSKTGSTEKVALALQEILLSKNNSVKLVKITPKQNLKAFEYKKIGKDLPLKDAPFDVKKFDLILVGTPVWSFCPTPIIQSYLRSLKNAQGKSFALFATCTALPGTTIQRMGSIISTKGGKVLASLTIKSVFELDRKKIEEAKKFAEGLGK